MAKRHWTGAVGNNAWDTAGNWLEEAVPAGGDEVYVRARVLVDGTTTDEDITEGLDQSAVRLAALHVEQSYRGKIGTAVAPLQIAAAQVDIGEHYGFTTPTGSPRVNLDLVHIESEDGPVVTVHNTAGRAEESDLAPVRLLAHDSDAVLYVRKGIVGVGMLGEAAQFAAIHQSYVSAVETDAVVVVGPNVAVATIDRVGGSMTLQCGATTVQNAAGDLLTVGAGAIGTLTVDGGTVVSNSSGTVTTLNANGGTADFTRSRAARTVTTPKIRAGATIKFDPAVVTFTNKVEAVGPVSLAAQAA